jgi:hypothetical protein
MVGPPPIHGTRGGAVHEEKLKRHTYASLLDSICKVELVPAPDSYQLLKRSENLGLEKAIFRDTSWNLRMYLVELLHVFVKKIKKKNHYN